MLAGPPTISNKGSLLTAVVTKERPLSLGQSIPPDKIFPIKSDSDHQPLAPVATLYNSDYCCTAQLTDKTYSCSITDNQGDIYTFSYQPDQIGTYCPGGGLISIYTDYGDRYTESLNLQSKSNDLYIRSNGVTSIRSSYNNGASFCAYCHNHRNLTLCSGAIDVLHNCAYERSVYCVYLNQTANFACQDETIDESTSSYSI